MNSDEFIEFITFGTLNSLALKKGDDSYIIFVPVSSK